MPRFIDELRSPKTKITMPYFVSANCVNDYIQIAEQSKHLIGLDLPVIVIDNVAKYMSPENSEKTWSLENFPNLAPPYHLFWCEYGTNVSQVGLLVRYQDPYTVLPSPDEGERVHKHFGDIAWTVCIIPYLNSHDTGPYGPHGGFSLYVDRTGKILGIERTYSFVDKDDQDGHQIEMGFLQFIYPVLLAICFMHFKNIIIKDNAVDRPLAKKYQAKYGVTPANYKTLIIVDKTLIIEPLKSILQGKGRAEKAELIRAMHICRGHVADYRQGNGLFGKLHGLFYMPEMRRGTKGKAPKGPNIEVRPPKIGF